ncbi:hypothetical protein I317_01805 [Kwoniella heveanensis CBS 569]|nr:hypothetical protein I317_01805 [Kwoniella heveanensis CBS 569]
MVPRHWLRLYTDSALLLSIAKVITSTPTSSLRLIFKSSPLQSERQQQGNSEKLDRMLELVLGEIRRLDMAIIVAGAIGRGRKEWILDTIKQLQALTCTNGQQNGDTLEEQSNDEPDSDRPTKRPRLELQRPGLSSASSPSAELRWARNPIPVLSSPPTIDEYLHHHSRKPFILRGYLSTDSDQDHDNDGLSDSGAEPTIGPRPPPWPAMERWRSARYLKQIAGVGRVVPVEVGGAYVDETWTQKIILFEEFLQVSGFSDAVQLSGNNNSGDMTSNADNNDCCNLEHQEHKWEGRSGSASDRTKSDLGHLKPDPPHRNDPRPDVPTQPLYLAQYALFDQFPELAKDISYPDYVWSEPPIPVDYPTYRPPETDDGVVVNVWVGSGGGRIVSPAHTDPYYNCYAQVVGQKRVWLAPPKCGPYMHAYGTKVNGNKGSSSSNSPTQPQTYGTGIGSDPESGPNTLAEQYMTNTSKVPIFRSKLFTGHGESVTTDIETETNMEAELRFSYPDFFEHVWSESMEGVLEPGDLLVMPPGWWHAMTGEGHGPGWSVSMWY